MPASPPGDESLGCLLYGIGGLFYGIVLTCIGVGAAGAGHGTYVVLGLYSSPLSLTQTIPVALFGTPLLWSIAAALVSAVRHWPARIVFLIAMAVHYGALPFVLASGSEFGDWDRAEKDPTLVTVGVIAYAFGQLILWVLFVLAVFSISPRFRSRASRSAQADD